MNGINQSGPQCKYSQCVLPEINIMSVTRKEGAEKATSLRIFSSSMSREKSMYPTIKEISSKTNKGYEIQVQ
jgi:hypothetical protein